MMPANPQPYKVFDRSVFQIIRTRQIYEAFENVGKLLLQSRRICGYCYSWEPPSCTDSVGWTGWTRVDAMFQVVARA